jgi:hypothetical protein
MCGLPSFQNDVILKLVRRPSKQSDGHYEFIGMNDPCEDRVQIDFQFFRKLRPFTADEIIPDPRGEIYEIE